MDRLYDMLDSYSKEDYYPMHMPGHKRNTKLLPMGNPYSMDITEINEFDNLHEAEGILKQLSNRISRLYKAGKSYPLINGSTAGILSGISAVTKKGDRILMSRNSHKSVFHAAALRELEPIYIYPQQIEDISISGGILAEQVEVLLKEYQDIKLVVITSPTYEGVVSDIREISSVVHQKGALLLVDEAHGAHFGFHDKFPVSAVTQGADIIIQSLHKTLPAFTQTAVLHSNRVEINHKIEKYLAIFQSSSPSYLLMGGMDRCISILEDNAKLLFQSFFDNLEDFYCSMKELKHLKLLDQRLIGHHGVYDLDPSKITVFAGNTTYTGHQIGKTLREKYRIVMEMEAKDYVLGMTSISDTKEGFDRLKSALLVLDQEAEKQKVYNKAERNGIIKPFQEMKPTKAMEQQTEVVKLEDSCGRIAAAFISLFPPGSPLLVPGEKIEEETLFAIHQAIISGLTITGLRGDNKDEIEVVN